MRPVIWIMCDTASAGDNRLASCRTGIPDILPLPLERSNLPHPHIRVQYLDGPGAERRAEEINLTLLAEGGQVRHPLRRHLRAGVALRWVDENVREAEQLEFAGIRAGLGCNGNSLKSGVLVAHVVAAELGYDVGVIVTQRHVPPPVQTPAWRATEQPVWARRRSISPCRPAPTRPRAQCTPTRRHAQPRSRCSGLRASSRRYANP